MEPDQEMRTVINLFGSNLREQQHTTAVPFVKDMLELGACVCDAIVQTMDDVSDEE